jgi:hypothetical protein
MSGLFGGKVKPQKIPDPKVVRMPTTEDPNAERASAKYRAAAAKRRGRRASILTENLQSMTGSSGQKLGN